jgi:hypothetical protein
MEQPTIQRPAQVDVEFAVEQLHNPEPHVYGFRLDLTEKAPDGFLASWVDFTSLEVISPDGTATHELVQPEMSFRAMRGGFGRIDYGCQINDRSMSISLSAILTDPRILEFAAAIFIQPTEVGGYRLRKVGGRIHYSCFER